MWFLCLSYCLMLPCWTGMSRANSVTLASEGSSAETCYRKEPQQKKQLLASGLSGAGWRSHPTQFFGPSSRHSPAPSGVPLTAEMEAFLMIISPPVLMLILISDCTDHDQLPQRADQLLSVSVSSSESLHHHTDAREELGTFNGGEAHKSLS